MRIAATAATLLLALASCSTTTPNTTSPYQQPNQLMSGEIDRRIEQIPYQHRDELLQNLLWLAQTGEQTIPSLLNGLNHESPKVRSSCAWVLGRIGDRRTIPNLQTAMRDSQEAVRLEAARSLVIMGDLAQAPVLIEGLDSDRKEVRYMCHEALKTSTGHDFGYDHLNQNQRELQVATLRWRQWWGEYSGDQFFAQSYERKHGLDEALAAPAGETKPQTENAGNGAGDAGNETPTPANSPKAANPSNPSNEAPGSSSPNGEDGAAAKATIDGSAPKPVSAPATQTGTIEAPKPAVKPQTNPSGQATTTTQTNTTSTTPAPSAGNATTAPTEAKPKTVPVVELPIVELPASKPTPKPAPKPNGGN